MILGIGTDLAEISRIRRVGLRRLAERILSKEELAWLPDTNQRRGEWLAGRFAAKEAVAKATGTGIGGQLSFREIEIFNDVKGKPWVRMAPEVLKGFGWEQDVTIHLSITHSEEHALAFVVVEGG